MLPKSRKESLSLGLQFYFTGKPCKKGHFFEKDVVRGCMICAKRKARELSAKYRILHKEKSEHWFILGMNLTTYSSLFKHKNKLDYLN